MNPIIPFQSTEFSVRIIDINNEPWFVGKDIVTILGYSNESDAMSKHCKGVAKRYPLQTTGGIQNVRILSESDVLRLIINSRLPTAEKFERWVFEEVLPTIRKTGGYQVKEKHPNKTASEALKLTPLAVRAARAFGLDKNAAAISANQYIRKLTQVNLLEEFGHTHLEAQNQDTLFFTPTDLGQRLHVSGREFNRLLVEKGFQIKQDE